MNVPRIRITGKSRLCINYKDIYYFKAQGKKKDESWAMALWLSGGASRVLAGGWT